MSWFAAHLVLYVKFKNEPQERYPAWENILLIEAEPAEDAFAKAEQRTPTTSSGLSAQENRTS